MKFLHISTVTETVGFLALYILVRWWAVVDFDTFVGEKPVLVQPGSGIEDIVAVQRLEDFKAETHYVVSEMFKGDAVITANQTGELDVRLAFVSCVGELTFASASVSATLFSGDGTKPFLASCFSDGFISTCRC